MPRLLIPFKASECTSCANETTSTIFVSSTCDPRRSVLLPRKIFWFQTIKNKRESVTFAAHQNHGQDREADRHGPSEIEQVGCSYQYVLSSRYERFAVTYLSFSEPVEKGANLCIFKEEHLSSQVYAFSLCILVGVFEVESLSLQVYAFSLCICLENQNNLVLCTIGLDFLRRAS